MPDDPQLRVISELLQRVLDVTSDTLLVVAVSGGPDSLALLHMLWRWRKLGGPALHVAHLDHAMRGADSAADAQFVAATAAAWGIPATVEQRDVSTYAQRSKLNRQAAARAVRYAFLARVAAATGAAAVLTAHHANDQAETVLMHLLRGAGAGGLRGMRLAVPWHEWAPRAITTTTTAAPPLVRPLLTTHRDTILAYCAEHNLHPRHDTSNDNPAYTRNRLRQDLMPLLETYNPNIVATLGRNAQISNDDYDALQQQLDQQWQTLVSERHGGLHFNHAAWHALPASLQRYALRRAVMHLLGGSEASFDELETVRTIVRRGAGNSATLSGLGVRVQHSGILLYNPATYVPASAIDALPDLPLLPEPRIPLRVPGTTPISATWEAAVFPGDTPISRGRWHLLLDSSLLDGDLVLRVRRPGDVIRIQNGSKKIQDVFVEARIPREVRAFWCLLATPTTVLWVAGLRADARFQATAATPQRLHIRLQRRTTHAS